MGPLSPVHVHVGRLVLRGASNASKDSIASALERELALRLAEGRRGDFAPLPEGRMRADITAPSREADLGTLAGRAVARIVRGERP
jgi:hypothetical protein